MTDDEIEQRLDAIEANLAELNTAVRALLHARVGADAPETDVQGYTAETVGAWLDGELARLRPASEAETEADVAGYMLGYDSQHYPYCSTRFLCPSRSMPGC